MEPGLDTWLATTILGSVAPYAIKAYRDEMGAEVPPSSNVPPGYAYGKVGQMPSTPGIWKKMTIEFGQPEVKHRPPDQYTQGMQFGRPSIEEVPSNLPGQIKQALPSTFTEQDRRMLERPADIASQSSPVIPAAQMGSGPVMRTLPDRSGPVMRTRSAEGMSPQTLELLKKLEMIRKRK